MRKILLISAVALAGGCTAEPPELSADAEARLAAELRDYEPAGPAVSCVPSRDLRGNRSVGEAAILFEGHGGRLWVNRPPAGCPDLNFGRTLVLRTTSSSFCRGDIATVADLGTGAQFGGCGLGEFEPYRRRD